jgi:short-subunit dehydrogenase
VIGIAGKVVVITGASSGIGRATALACAMQGARVVAVARREPALETLSEECDRLGAAIATVPVDVTEAGAQERVAGTAEETFGRIDAWVNNAGVYAVGGFEQTPEQIFERVLDVNLIAVARGSRVALARFRAQGSGTLVNVASMVAGLPGPCVSAYATSKWGVRGLSLALHAELRDEPSIHVCIVRPASIDTPIFRQAANLTGRRIKALEPTYPAEQVADAIVALLERPRREVVVGRAGRALVLARHLAPGLVDRMWSPRAVRDQFDGDSPAQPPEGNLFKPNERWGVVSGGWRDATK